MIGMLLFKVDLFKKHKSCCHLRRWWMIPAVLAVTFPCDLYGRATIACAAFAGEIAIAMAESSMQLANATGGATWSRPL